MLFVGSVLMKTLMGNRFLLLRRRRRCRTEGNLKGGGKVYYNRFETGNGYYYFVVHDVFHVV